MTVMCNHLLIHQLQQVVVWEEEKEKEDVVCEEVIIQITYH
jgi:hypothetical protein